MDRRPTSILQRCVAGDAADTAQGRIDLALQNFALARTSPSAIVAKCCGSSAASATALLPMLRRTLSDSGQAFVQSTCAWRYLLRGPLNSDHKL